MPFHLMPRKRLEPTSTESSIPHAIMLMRSVIPLGAGDSLQRAVHLLVTQHVPALPVVDNGLLAGWVTEASVAARLAMGGESHRADPIETVCSVLPPVLEPLARLPEIAQAMQDHACAVLPVVSDGRYQGIITQTDLLAAQTGHLTPPRIGGMATPLGVYLTTGNASGGAGALGLLLTGAVMAVMLWLVQVILIVGLGWLYQVTRLPLVRDVYRVILEAPVSGTSYYEVGTFILASTLLMAGFLTLLRVFPRMAGFHAAEHQTVNAIEAGEPLTVEHVARMPRVHPRCGTNLWGFMSLTYLGVAIFSMLLSLPSAHAHLPLVMSLIVWYIIFVVLNWRRVGGWLQQHLTTRPASPRELASGVQAGEEVLRNHQTTPSLPAGPLQRIWRMGLPQVMIGAIIMGYLLELAQWPLDVLLRYLVK